MIKEKENLLFQKRIFVWVSIQWIGKKINVLPVQLVASFSGARFSLCFKQWFDL